MANAERHPITRRPVVYGIPGMESVQVRRDVQYASCDAGPLTLDLYLPSSRGERSPAVVLVTGYPDVGVARPLGCAFKEMAMWTSLAQLIAASGMAAISYTAHDPFNDLDAVLHRVSSDAFAPDVDAGRLALWAF